MRSKISISKLEGNTPLDRLQQIRMGAHDRLLAEAHLARAEFLAELLVGTVDLAKRALRAVVLRPLRRAAAAFT